MTKTTDSIPESGWAFVLAHQGTIIKISRSLMPRASEEDRADMTQTAMLYIARVADRYDPERGEPRSFIWCRVRRVVCRNTGKKAPKRRTQELPFAFTPEGAAPTSPPMQHTIAVLADMAQKAEEGAFDAAVALAMGKTGPEIEAELGVNRTRAVRWADRMVQGYMTEPKRVLDCSKLRAPA